jgi:hypothetical protein
VKRFDLLQPDTPGLYLILWFLGVEQLKDVATKELQLVRASSGSRLVTGGHAFLYALD